MLLESLQQAHKTMSIVVDEYGWVAGLVTIEDIIEQVFWDIRDETDKEAEEFIKVWKDHVRVESDVLIEDVLDEFNLTLEDIWLDNKEFNWETVSYIITHILDRFPNTWEIIDFDVKVNELIWKLSMEILSVENAKIWKINVKFIQKKELWSKKS
jgi:CBS domain containing-hemolysin-like protein